MKLVILCLGVLAGVLNPLTGSFVQSAVLQAWDFAMVNAGVWVTLAFGVVCVFYGGMLWAKMQVKDKKKLSANIAKAKQSKRDLGGMKYQAVGKV